LAGKPPLIVIAGPTTSGKTGLSIQLAHKLDGEIVAMDSMQVYLFMDIGTAKPTLEEQEGITHHMLDVVNPSDSYSVAEYAVQARECIHEIHEKGKIPILVGGTGLYLKALTGSMTLGGAQGNSTIRDRLYAICEKDGPETLIAMLQEVDPVSALRQYRNDIRRIIRALEVYELTGRPFSDQQPGSLEECPYRFCTLGLQMDRETLYSRIESRVDVMMNAGLLAEVEKLLCMGVTPQAQSMQGLGYKELLPVLLNGLPLPLAIDAIKLGTRHYAKRQMTWFRRTEGIAWLDAMSDSLAEQAQKAAHETLDI
jgi:tRNA dimethylallyltransferase